MAKAIALFSGGLDSRIAIKMLQEQGIDVESLSFNLPFGGSCCKTTCSFNFTQTEGIKSEIVDCTSGELFKEYLEIVKNPKHGRGSGMNPCIDCKTFMFKKAEKIMKDKKADFIVTGEVVGQRPMSQNKKALDVIEEESGLKGKLIRPLSAKLLPETEAEKKKLIDRDKLLDIHGRYSKKQMELAEKYGIKYPNPAGGCLLCEKEFAGRLKDLLSVKEDIEFKDIELLRLGRHFLIEKSIIVVGRNKEENEKIMELGKIKMEVKDVPSPVTTIIGEVNDKIMEKAKELTIKYSDAEKLKKENPEVITRD